MKRILRDQQGFTLLEVMIAMFILAVALLTLVTMQVTGIKGNSTASQISTAADWGSSQIEAIFGMSYDDDRLKDATVESYAKADENHKTPSSDGLYTLYWNVTDDQPLPNMKKIQVVINKTDQGQTRSVVMNYIKSRFLN